MKLNDVPETAADEIFVKDNILKRIAYLTELFSSAKLANVEFREAIEAVALEARIRPNVLRQFVAARCSDNYAKKRRDSNQLTLLFTEIGE